MTCCLPGSSPSRHFERREDPGDEVALDPRGGVFENKPLQDSNAPYDLPRLLTLPAGLTLIGALHNAK